ncbi:aspartate aminotransferase [Streptococcus pyogenes]|nr:aspartate aminotransferase [Streptococcus pyogenes]
MEYEVYETMKIIEKSSKLEHVAYDIRGPVLDEANRMIASGEKILRLNTGNPAAFGFEAPDEVIRDLIVNARLSEGYSDSKGIFSARKAIMQYCQLKGFPDVDIEDIYLGNGVSELISMSLQALLDNGDEVLVPMPDYPLWTACVSLGGGKAVHYLCDEEAGWYPDIADIKSKITSRTKAIVVINPNNPTGALYPKEILEDIVVLAREHQLIIFADEIYDRLVMDGKEHIAIASLAPDVFCVSMNGLSKSHRIAGFRVGWMVLSGPKDHVKGYIEGLNMLANMRLCSNVLAQQVVQTSLGGHQSVDALLLPGGRIFEQRNFIYEAINAIPGLSAVKPEAGLYLFPKIDRQMYRIDDDEEFVLQLLKQEKVMLVHGRGFNWKDPDHFRIVYLPSVEELEDVQEKITRVLYQYRR